MWGSNFFLMLLINGSSFIRLKWPKEEKNVSKLIIHIIKKKKKYKTLINIKKINNFIKNTYLSKELHFLFKHLLSKHH